MASNKALETDDWIKLSEDRLTAQTPAWDQALNAMVLSTQSNFNGREMLRSSDYVNRVVVLCQEDLEERSSYIWSSLQEIIDGTKYDYEILDEDHLRSHIAAMLSEQYKKVTVTLERFTKNVSESLSNKTLLQTEQLGATERRLIDKYQTEAGIYIRQRRMAKGENRVEILRNLILSHPVVSVVAIVLMGVAFLFGLVPVIIEMWETVWPLLS